MPRRPDDAVPALRPYNGIPVTPLQAARGVLASPEVLAEVLRLLAWTDPDACEAAIRSAQEAREKRLAEFRERPAPWWRERPVDKKPPRG